MTEFTGYEKDFKIRRYQEAPSTTSWADLVKDALNVLLNEDTVYVEPHQYRLENIRPDVADFRQFGGVRRVEITAHVDLNGVAKAR